MVSGPTVGRFIYDVDDDPWQVDQRRKFLVKNILEQSVFEEDEIGWYFTNGEKRMLKLHCCQIFHAEKETGPILAAVEFTTLYYGTHYEANQEATKKICCNRTATYKKDSQTARTESRPRQGGYAKICTAAADQSN